MHKILKSPSQPKLLSIWWILSEKYTSDEKLKYCEEAVYLANEAVFSEHFRIHPAYLETELLIGQNTHSERRIVDACNTVIRFSSNENAIEKAKEILERFEELRRIFKAKKTKLGNARI